MKAPLRWPNRIASSIVSGSAAQLTAVKGPRARGRAVVDVAGEAFLAGAGLAEQQHRGVAGGDAGGEIEHRRARRLAAGRAAARAEQLGGQRVAEGEVGLAIAKAGGGACRRAREGGGGDAIIEDEIIGGGAGLLIRREHGEALVPALAGSEDRRRQTGAGQEACQGRIGDCDLFADTDHHTPGSHSSGEVQAACQLPHASFRPLARIERGTEKASAI